MIAIAISYDLHVPLNTAKVQFASISITFVKATGQQSKLLRLASLFPPPRVYMLKKCVALPFVIKRPVLQSAGTHV